MPKLHSWEDLRLLHCTDHWVSKGGSASTLNPHYEEMSQRRYNYAKSPDSDACRLVFLKGVLENENTKTLLRHGRFIWCRNFQYEGVGPNGYRQLSFTVDKGQKRFLVEENNILCIPAKSYISNNKYFRKRRHTFRSFGHVFGYKNALRMLQSNSPLTSEQFYAQLKSDNPYKPGTLVAPRLGYFYPTIAPPLGITQPSLRELHPYGIILGRSVENNEAMAREFYRVRFSGTTYERVHPVQMEIINEV